MDAKQARESKLGQPTVTVYLGTVPVLALTFPHPRKPVSPELTRQLVILSDIQTLVQPLGGEAEPESHTFNRTHRLRRF